MTRPLTIAVLVSGEGTTLEALAELAAGGHLPARIALVVSDRPHAPAIEKARRRGLPTLVLPSHGVPKDAWSRRLTEALAERAVELVVNAGFLTILPADWLADWKGRAINVHPSLLPRYGGRGFYGNRVHEAVLAAGDRETGATVHVVTEAIDGGPKLGRRRLAVRAGDTPESLRTRLHPIEVDLLVDTLRRFADGTLPLPYPVAEPGTGRKPPGAARGDSA